MGGFITLEGPEGGGKTTQAALLAEALAGQGERVVRVREPGGTALGDALRAVLLRDEIPAPEPRAEALLYCAARRQLVNDVIRPALAAGAVVIADRFADSTLAYQGAGRGLPLPELRGIVAFAVEDCWPDLTVLLDLPVVEGLARKQAQAGGEWTRFEAESFQFHERVRAGFQALVAAEPRRWLVLDARAPAAELHRAILGAVLARLAER